MLARTLVAITLVLACKTSHATTSHARDNGQFGEVSADVKKWVEGLTDDRGRGCCATADGFRPDEVEWDMADNSYRVMISGAWVKVPDGAVIKEANKIGHAMVWYFVFDGVVTIRCFLPGSGA
jgi:hypothetical protein